MNDVTTTKASEATTGNDVGQWTHTSDKAWHVYREPETVLHETNLVWLGCTIGVGDALAILHGSKGLLRKGAFLFPVTSSGAFARDVEKAHAVFLHQGSETRDRARMASVRAERDVKVTK